MAEPTERKRMLEEADLDFIRQKRDAWQKQGSELNAKAKAMDDYPWSDESILRALYSREADLALRAAEDLAFIYSRFSGDEIILLA